MSDHDPDSHSEQRMFRTLRGFLADDEPDEEPYFAYRATLRISGDQLDFDDISHHLGLAPTRSHRKGERCSPRSPSYRQDMWSYSPMVAEERPLSEHIDTLWADTKHAKCYLCALKQVAKVDVFLGYRSNIDTAGVEVPHTCLQIFTELEIPFGLSIIIA
jgi:hypothetical protein